MAEQKADQQNDFMTKALETARAAVAAGEVPVGAVLVDGTSGEMLALTHNLTEEIGDPTAHAEMLAIRIAAQQLGTKRLENCDLYVTLEPCAMCASAISHARLRKLTFGAYDPKGGGVEHGARVFKQSTCHHKPEVIGGVSETEAGELLKEFFQAKR